MTQILKSGNRHKFMRFRKFTCNRCGCIFVADSESFESGIDATDPLLRTIYDVECPYCYIHISTMVSEEVADMFGSPKDQNTL